MNNFLYNRPPGTIILATICVNQSRDIRLAKMLMDYRVYDKRTEPILPKAEIVALYAPILSVLHAFMTPDHANSLSHDLHTDILWIPRNLYYHVRSFSTLGSQPRYGVMSVSTPRNRFRYGKIIADQVRTEDVDAEIHTVLQNIETKGNPIMKIPNNDPAEPPVESQNNTSVQKYTDKHKAELHHWKAKREPNVCDYKRITKIVSDGMPKNTLVELEDGTRIEGFTEITWKATPDGISMATMKVEGVAVELRETATGIVILPPEWVPEDVFVRHVKHKKYIYAETLEDNSFLCPCGKHHTLTESQIRILSLKSKVMHWCPLRKVMHVIMFEDKE